MHIENDNIIVSVSIITYNHKNYIRKAIESVLMQKTNFNYEIIIGDDCSSDGTQAILKEYAAKYPEKIHLILHPRRYDNIPGRVNNTTNLYACRGKYIAMLDGDDYWISPNKLQKQVAFLEENQDYSLCFHNARIFSEENKFPEYYQHEKYTILDSKTTFKQEELSLGFSFLPASSILFRNKYLIELPEWFWRISSADYALTLIITSYGKAKFLKDLLSAYRVNEYNFTSSFYEPNDTFIKQWKQNLIFEKHFKKLDFSKRKAIICYNYSSFLASKKSYFKMIRYMYKAVKFDRNNLKNYSYSLRKNFFNTK